MSFLAQVAAGLIIVVLGGLLSTWLTTGHLPKTILLVPWWAWLIGIGAAGIVAVAVIIRRRRMGTIRVGYIKFPDDSEG